MTAIAVAGLVVRLQVSPGRARKVIPVRAAAKLVSVALEPLLLLGRAFGRRVRLEPLVRNRLPTLDREPVRSVGKPPLRPLDGLELALELFLESLVELVLNEVCRVVGEMLEILVLVRQLAVIRCSHAAQRALDSPALLP